MNIPTNTPKCDVPPPGWYCTRTKGHDGPCASWPMNSQPDEALEAHLSQISWITSMATAKVIDKEITETELSDKVNKAITEAKAAILSQFIPKDTVRAALPEKRTGLFNPATCDEYCRKCHIDVGYNAAISEITTALGLGEGKK
jgi:hypothetical protein